MSGSLHGARAPAVQRSRKTVSPGSPAPQVNLNAGLRDLTAQIFRSAPDKRRIGHELADPAQKLTILAKCLSAPGRGSTPGAVCVRARTWDTSAGGLRRIWRRIGSSHAQIRFRPRFSRTRRAHRRGLVFPFPFQAANGARRHRRHETSAGWRRGGGGAGRELGAACRGHRHVQGGAGHRRRQPGCGNRRRNRLQERPGRRKGRAAGQARRFHRAGRSARQSGADEERPGSLRTPAGAGGARRRGAIQFRPRPGCRATRPPAPRTRPAP